MEEGAKDGIAYGMPRSTVLVADETRSESDWVVVMPADWGLTPV